MGSDLASLLVKDAGIFLAIFGSFFLFWRACRFELFTSEQIFDVLLIAALGGLFLGRLIGFAINFDQFGLSFYRLLFFNAYPAFNFWGFIIGSLIATALYLRNKKVTVWSFSDLAAGPLIFGIFVYCLFLSGSYYIATKTVDFQTLILASAYFLLFFVVERLATLKRHAGFFSGYFLVFVPAVSVLRFLFFGLPRSADLKSLFEVGLDVSVLLFGALLWYRLGKRSLGKDIKNVAGFVFLQVVGLIRTIKSVNEAGKVARAMIFTPYNIVRLFLVLLRSLVKEIWLGFDELLYTLGVKHLR